MSMQIYMLKKEEVTKQIRYCGKNMFVFPEFYGDWYLHCARQLWDAIAKMSLATASGVPLKDHLRSKGIKRLGNCEPGQDGRIREPEEGTFLRHLKEVEHDFWNNRFKKYKAWKDEWWELYLKRGYFTSFTGFTERGIYKRNDVLNHAIQGEAAHCLLQVMVWLNQWLVDERKKSVIVGPIHDSIVGDVHEDEVNDYIDHAKSFLTEDLPDQWKWIIVPLDVEIEVAEPGESWWSKKKLEN